MTDYTYAKKEPVELERCLLKLGVLRCLERECEILNGWFKSRVKSKTSVEEEELGQTRFMELLSGCGVYQKVSELILEEAARALDRPDDAGVMRVVVDHLTEFLGKVESLTPSLLASRAEIVKSQNVSFFPGLGELFTPGSKIVCFPEGMEGTPLGCSVVQNWYAEDLNKATGKTKKRFILVIEFMVSVGDELVFVAASDVYPEFHDLNRSMPIKDLNHRVLLPDASDADAALLNRLQQRGEFYASVATKNHYLQYQSDSFFPVIGGGWKNNAVRPLSKGGRVMIDVKRGIQEGHIPVRGSADGTSDTVKEAIKLWEQSKRTGVAVPFRSAILPGFDGIPYEEKIDLIGHDHMSYHNDRNCLWMTWPMLSGFSFTARVWGKLLLSLPKSEETEKSKIGGRPSMGQMCVSPQRPSIRKLGVEIGGLGGVGSAGNAGYIHFREQAFEQLVLDDDKKELIRAVARNAGGSTALDENDSEDDDDIGLDVVANKGAASIFLLHGPPGCGKTLTAEAIAELLRKPLYVVTAGDLGITAAEVEKTLGAVLELCQTWDALVLIDEADIFLEARSSHEIQRNALVCVMLRLLEYYSGCLFLSSNRAKHTIDVAIASRITVMLGYPPLDEEGRSKVWQNLLALIPVVPKHKSKRLSRYREDFTSEDYTNLAQRPLNGRQIKNSIVLARALARERNLPLAMDILRRAVTAVAGDDEANNSN